MLKDNVDCDYNVLLNKWRCEGGWGGDGDNGFFERWYRL